MNPVINCVFRVSCKPIGTDSGDEVVLQVEDPQLPAPPVHMLDPLDVLLVQRNLLQGEDLTVVVLGPPPDQLLCDWMGKKHGVHKVLCDFMEHF